MKTFFELREAAKEKMPSVKTPSVAELAKKYDVDVSEVEDALEDGIEHEMEHTTDKSVAREIALDHLGDDLEYYEKLEDMEGEDDDEEEDDDKKNVKEGADKFIGSYEYKGVKHTYKRRGDTMSSPIVVFLNNKEWQEFGSIQKAKKATIDHIKSMKEETYSPQKHEWGKPESTRYAKKMTPGEEVEEASDMPEPGKGTDKADKISLRHPKDGPKGRVSKVVRNSPTHRKMKMKGYKEVSEDKDPCWDSHKQVGMKKKNGKTVPNCVPKEAVDQFRESLQGKLTKKCPEGGAHEWVGIADNNGHPTYSLTDRCKKCKATRKVNPKNGRVQYR